MVDGNFSNGVGDSIDSVDFSQFYARQAHLIDCGQHEAWSETFLETGEFHSPTYPKPAIGRGDLEAISESFAASADEASEVRRHIVTNLWVEMNHSTSATARFVLLVVGSTNERSRIVRVMNAIDRLVLAESGWKVGTRHIKREPSI